MSGPFVHLLTLGWCGCGSPLCWEQPPFPSMFACGEPCCHRHCAATRATIREAPDLAQDVCPLGRVGDVEEESHPAEKGLRKGRGAVS